MKIPECHPERAHQAFGLCSQCYSKQHHAKNAEQRNARRRKRLDEYAPNYRRPPRRPSRAPDCHPDREHVALGLCRACYQKDRPGRARATCHPDRPSVVGGKCNSCYKRRQYQEDPERVRAQVRVSQAKIRKRNRDELVEAYGGRCACRNCPETNPAFLCLDHVNGDGSAHRMKMGGHVYDDLRRRGWPKDGYRLLCWNCNSMTRFGRTCPHEEEH